MSMDDDYEIPPNVHTLSTKAENSLPSAFALANNYLALRHSRSAMLICHRDEFFSYQGDHYEPLPYTDLRADVTKFLQQNAITRDAASTNRITSIIENIRGIINVTSSIEPPAMLSDQGSEKRNLVPMKNAIFDLDSFIAGKVQVLNHTPDYFCINVLPYEFNPEARCPKFLFFLEEMIEDIEVRNLIQEWLGYQFLRSTSYQKFMMMVGEGANGKSVLCTVMRELLGTHNVSAVALEQLNPSRTFPMAALIGKLANIAEEIGEVDRAAEGLLKQLVSGGLLTIERKNRDPFETSISTKLTFATNVLPKIRDRSQGLWRRMLLIKFSKQILDESKQDKSLVDPEWWQQSGELPGIFNWAIEGLVRLNKRGHFIEPQSCIEAKKVYQEAANPAATFLLDNCEPLAGQEVPSNELYPLYWQWVKDRGGMPLGEPLFAEEVRKAFPSVTLSKNARHRKGARTRVWEGLAWRGNEKPVNHGIEHRNVDRGAAYDS